MIYIGITITAFAIGFLLVPLNSKFSRLIGNIDYPRERSVHIVSTPKSGGISIFFTLVFMQILFVTTGIFNSGKLPIYFLIGGFLVVLLGVLDDRFEYSAWKKLIAESCIVILMYYFGFKIDLLTNPFGSSIVVGVFSFPLTLVWYLLIMNSINLIDGLDGLATGIVAIVFLVSGIAGIICGNLFVAYFSFCFVGSCLAFLKYNFHPAEIFLGDAGSLFLGFSIATLSITGNIQFKGAASLTLLVPLIVLMIPLFDTFHAIFRRLKTPRSIFQADKSHLHHKMLDLGFSYKTVVFIAYFLTILLGLISIGFMMINQKILFSLLVVFALFALIIFYQIVKKEFFK